MEDLPRTRGPRGRGRPYWQSFVMRSTFLSARCVVDPLRWASPCALLLSDKLRPLLAAPS